MTNSLTGGGRRRTKSASFHGRIPTEQHTGMMRRPKTQPDLLPHRAGGSAFERLGSARVPTKVLVNVTVQRSLWAVQVVASTDWTVEDLIGACVQQYVKEGRRPLLSSTHPSHYRLHYSHFTLHSLDPRDKLVGLGSRNFFLCPKQLQPALHSTDRSSTTSGSSSAAAAAAASCSNQATKEAPPPMFTSLFRFLLAFLQ